MLIMYPKMCPRNIEIFVAVLCYICSDFKIYFLSYKGMNFEEGGTTKDRNGQIGGHRA